jgi:hypothetical protein
MFVRVGSHSRPVETVDSNTQLTLRDEWNPGTAAGTAYSLDAVKQVTNLVDVKTGATDGPSSSRRSISGFVYGQNGRIRIQRAGRPVHVREHRLLGPAGGCATLGPTRSTTRASRSPRDGVWTISNMDFDLTDDAGNVQQQLSQISKDVMLWGDQGSRRGRAR